MYIIVLLGCHGLLNLAPFGRVVKRLNAQKYSTRQIHSETVLQIHSVPQIQGLHDVIARGIERRPFSIKQEIECGSHEKVGSVRLAVSG